jgi:undecaprenyl-diphosphatase
MNLDLWLFKIINQTFSNSFFDWLFPAITDLHKNNLFAIPVLIILFASLLCKFKKRAPLYFMFFILAVSTSDFTGGKIKHIFNRPRPFQNIEATSIQRSPASENTSFYSNHASNNFTFATLAGFVFPQGKVVFFIAATLISYSRVYNGVHYPSDVFTGALAGIFWGLCFQFLLNLILKKIKKVQS